MDLLPSVADPFILENPNIKKVNISSNFFELGNDAILLRSLLDSSKLFHNFNNVPSIQNSSKLDFAFLLHCIRFALCLIYPLAQ